MTPTAHPLYESLNFDPQIGANLEIQNTIVTMATTTVTVVVALLMVLSLAVEVRSRPGGAPVQACSSLRPSHPAPATDRSDPPGGYFIYTELLNNGNNGTYMASRDYDGESDIALTFVLELPSLN